MSATVAIVASGVAANAAIQAEHSAKVAMCSGVMQSYVAAGAAVEDAKRYADCVSFLYPNPASTSDTLAMKFLLVLLLIGFVIGAIRPPMIFGRVEFMDRFVGAFVGLLCGFILFCAIGAIFFVVTA